MSRVAIVLLLLLALGAGSAGTYLLVFPRVADLQLGEATAGLETAGRLLQEMDASERGRLVEKFRRLAEREDLIQVLRERPADETERKSWLVRLRAEAAGLSAAAREVTPVRDFFILDRKGVGLVRNLDLHWTGKPPSKHAEVEEAIEVAAKGEPVVVMVEDEKGLTRVVATPVVDRGRRIGILLGLFAIDDGVARDRGSELPQGVGFGYVTAAGLVARAMPIRDGQVVEAYLAQRTDLCDRLVAGNRIEAQTLDSAQGPIRMIGVPLKGLGGLVVVRSVAHMKRPLLELGLYLFGGTGLVFVFLLVLTMLLGGGVTRNLKGLRHDLELLVQGDRFAAVRVRGPALIRSIARLINRLAAGQPRALPAPDDTLPVLDVEPAPKPKPNRDSGPNDVLDSNPRPEARDGEDDYFLDLFERFRQAKQAQGDSLDKLGYERFRAKLEKQAEQLLAKHGCRSVRFEVKIKSGEVSLSPRIVH